MRWAAEGKRSLHMCLKELMFCTVERTENGNYNPVCGFKALC